MKFGCATCIFLNSENLICRSTDISKCFRGSIQLRDNESRLYLKFHMQKVEIIKFLMGYVCELEKVGKAVNYVLC